MRPGQYSTLTRALTAATPPGSRRRASAWTGAALSLALLATGALSAAAEPRDLPVIDDTGVIEVMDKPGGIKFPDLVLPVSESQSEIPPLQLSADTSGGQLAKDPDATTTFTQVASNGASSFAVTTDGQVYAWGHNGDGQLGDGTTIDRTTPVLIEGLSNISRIIASGASSFAITTDGQVYAWGYNGDFRLGDGTTDDRPTPVLIEGLSSIGQIATNGDTSFAVTTDGQVYAWGNNESGRLGDGTTNDRTTPVLIEGLSNIGHINARGGRTFAVTTDGHVYGWGYDYGNTPVLIEGLSNISQIATVGYSSFAITTDGQLYAWGRNNYGQLGDGTRDDRTTPVLIEGLSDISQIQITWDSFSSFAITTDGRVYAWGYNCLGQLGANMSSNTPVLINDLSHISQIVISTNGDSSSSFAITTDGQVYAWGRNEYGELGDGTRDDRRTPVLIEGLSNISQIATDPWNHSSFAVTSEGQVYAWGRNYYGQLGDGTTITRTTPVRILGPLPTTVPPTTGTFTGGAVQISGTAKVGSKLTAEASGVTPTPTYTYSWLRGSTVLGTGATYVPTADDLGAKLTVRVSATLAGYEAKTISATTAKIEANITVNVPRNQSSIVDKAITVVTVPVATVSPADVKITYSVTGLPTGLTFNKNTRQISGVPKAVATDPKTVTVTVKMASGATASKTFTWTVKRPTITTRVPADQVSTLNKSIKAVKIPKANINSDSPITYTVTGLPKGLTFKAATMQITGKPTVATAMSKTVTVKATARGVTSTKTFFWKVTK